MIHTAHFLKSLLIGTLLLTVTLVEPSAADETSSDAGVSEQSVTRKLQSARPDLKFTLLDREPLFGFYQVQIESGPLLLVHSSGEYFLQGDLLQIESGRIVNVLDNQLTDERRALLADRTTEDMIIFKPKGKTAAIMNVFTDVDCGYCRKLHREVPQLNAMGIEIRYLAYPRAGIPSESYNKIATAWCAADKQAVLTKIKAGETVPTEVCDTNPVAAHFSLGQQMGVTGTPAIILMDGTLIPGYQPAENFAKLLGIDDSNS